MSKKNSKLFDSSAEDETTKNEKKIDLLSKPLPPLPANSQHEITQETDKPPPIPPRSPISSRSATSDEERRPLSKKPKPIAKKPVALPRPGIFVSSTDEDIPPPRPPRPDVFPTSKNKNTAQIASNPLEEPPPLSERRSKSPQPPKVAPRKKKSDKSDQTDSSTKSDKCDSAAENSENDPLTGAKAKSPRPPPKVAKKPSPPKNEKTVNSDVKADSYAAKQQHIAKKSAAFGGFRKPPPGAIPIFGPMSSPFVPPKRHPSPVEPVKDDSVCTFKNIFFLSTDFCSNLTATQALRSGK